jgi:hypothetical protein
LAIAAAALVGAWIVVVGAALRGATMRFGRGAFGFPWAAVGRQLVRLARERLCAVLQVLDLRRPCVDAARARTLGREGTAAYCPALSATGVSRATSALAEPPTTAHAVSVAAMAVRVPERVTLWLSAVRALPLRL